MRRCLSQQTSIRKLLYTRLNRLMTMYPSLFAEDVCELLWSHVFSGAAELFERRLMCPNRQTRQLLSLDVKAGFDLRRYLDGTPAGFHEPLGHLLQTLGTASSIACQSDRLPSKLLEGEIVARTLLKSSVHVSTCRYFCLSCRGSSQFSSLYGT